MKRQSTYVILILVVPIIIWAMDYVANGKRRDGTGELNEVTGSVNEAVALEERTLSNFLEKHGSPEYKMGKIKVVSVTHLTGDLPEITFEMVEPWPHVDGPHGMVLIKLKEDKVVANLVPRTVPVGKTRMKVIAADIWGQGQEESSGNAIARTLVGEELTVLVLSAK